MCKMYLFKNISVSFTEYLHPVQKLSAVHCVSTVQLLLAFVFYVRCHWQRSPYLCMTQLEGMCMPQQTGWVFAQVVSFTVFWEVWLSLDMKTKGQIVKSSHFSSHLSLKPLDTLHLVIRLPINTIVDYRSVCAHAIALYIFRKGFCKLWTLSFWVSLGLSFVLFERKTLKGMLVDTMF